MCGRYTLITNQEFFSRFSLEDKYHLSPKYEAAPGMDLPIITNAQKNKLEIKKWGLTIPWSEKQLIFNARAETLKQKPLYQELLTENRCLIPSTGFYEWHSVTGQKKKIPYFFDFPHNQYFSFAGLFKDNAFTIITTTPNNEVSPVHPRMPVILNLQTEKIWLSSVDYLSVLKPFESEKLLVHPLLP